MSSDTAPDATATAPTRIIEQSMLRVANLRQKYILAAQQDMESDPNLRQEFHAAVINYYFALRPYRTEDAISKKWQTAKLWQRENGEYVTGFDTLSNWVANKTPVESDTDRRGSKPAASQTTQQLPPQVLLRVSSALDDIANDLGIAIDVTYSQRPAGELPIQAGGDNDE